ncbi:TraB/GumN family protein [Paucibacter sp. Y2R2-4]|uniref:TraB/GumN family protein n=1 Tax=Paucibacter sp. Y2R2-4 TaxID=2893553 RepID=UPI0021E3EDDB|nr:TraB/GumN family protein [Paucibacter sp. Y2R2-4]MCV2350784.1 TraB/GumN family protein [Paucibacter sp. Y2R2-4]
MKNLLKAFSAALLLWGSAQAQPPGTACPPPVLPIAEAPGEQSAAPQDVGLLWRLQRDGRSSYLYGSMHIGRPAWARPGPALQKALQEVDVLALELNISDAHTQADLARSKRADRNALPAKLQSRLDAQVSAACLPAKALAALHPMLQLSTLTVLAARWDGLDMAYGQELMLSSQAQARGMPIVGLERADDQMQALFPKDRKSLLRSLDEGLQQLEQNRVRPAVLRLARAWEQGDLGDLQRYEQWCDCVQSEDDRAWLGRLNDGRNPHLAAGIAALHSKGQSVLAAVGALHMSGPQALPKLLSERGFRVEQIHPPPTTPRR